MAKNNDKETQKVYNEGEKAYYLTKTDDWDWAKKKLLQKLSNLDSVKTLKEENKDIALEIRSRKQTIDIILEWLDEIEGVAQQHIQQNKELLEDVEKEDYINNQEEGEEGED